MSSPSVPKKRRKEEQRQGEKGGRSSLPGLTEKDGVRANALQACLYEAPALPRLTWSVEGEDIAFTFGGALGRVGL